MNTAYMRKPAANNARLGSMPTRLSFPGCKRTASSAQGTSTASDSSSTSVTSTQPAFTVSRLGTGNMAE